MSAVVAEVAVVNLDQLPWQAWKSMDVPEGFRAEIIEGAITLSPTDGVRHFTVNRRLGQDLYDYLKGTGYAPGQDGNVIAGLKVLIPDVFVAPNDVDEIEHPEGVGVLAIPEGPAKGFVIGPEITGERRG
ncbi:Uma2 family endonuclease [Streptomyces sp. 1331.2]|uniref:Uma2 family endonuclease n=1 Tax=Streptomyces sp. 1331.2 TaxID=1938835 RepID=UPI000BCD7530|nr:Uma2 family endonuclease [Streptomyces sp. 1331.2]SOB82838.1 Putative restriction endonuclease [Streptomyces sp. 1331.2]